MATWIDMELRLSGNDRAADAAAELAGELDDSDRPLCRIIPTRLCPHVYQGVCGDRPCARYESDSLVPWS